MRRNTPLWFAARNGYLAALTRSWVDAHGVRPDPLSERHALYVSWSEAYADSAPEALPPAEVIQRILALAAEAPFTAAEAETELRAEGVDVDGFKQRLMEKVQKKRQEVALEAKVKEWHESDSTLPLHEYLGMTEQGYADWVTGSPQSLVQKMRASYEAALASELQAHAQVLVCVEDLQGCCEHPESEVIEAPELSDSYSFRYPPFRVCKVCGYSEEGFGCGYKLLRYGSYSVRRATSRMEAIGFMIGRMRTQVELYP
jgi:hypothetical protein